MPDMQVPSVVFQIGFCRVDSPSALPVVLLISRLALASAVTVFVLPIQVRECALVHNG